jgi:hypothetical protein
MFYKNSVIIFMIGCLTSSLVGNEVLTTANLAKTNSLTCLPKSTTISQILNYLHRQHEHWTGCACSGTPSSGPYPWRWPSTRLTWSAVGLGPASGLASRASAQSPLSLMMSLGLQPPLNFHLNQEVYGYKFTGDQPRLRNGAMLILKCFFIILCVLYI